MPAPIRAFVIGQPIAHSRSPVIHGHWLRELGIAGSYERIEVAPADVPAFLESLPERGFAGGNVTIPHKEAVFAAADRRTERATRLAAVNTLWRDPDGALVGDNTDGLGFVAGLDQAATGWDGGCRTALVLGAGGAARAVVAALADRGVGRIVVANRTAERAQALMELAPGRTEPLGWNEIAAVLPETDLLVNTTQLGMKGQPPLDLDLDLLPDRAVVTDIVYVPLETRLLAAARRRGLRAVDGLGMLLHQAVPGFTRWFGQVPTVSPALRAAVEADLAARP